jgi:PBP1b-binding outer membrane lipoprotein LpoB
MKRMMLAAGGALALSGCLSYPTITASDLRKPEYAYKTVHLDKSVPEIRQAIFDYEANCRAFESVKVDPSGAKRITITRTALEMARDTIYMVVDINADDSGATLKSFTYHDNSGWHKRADEVLGAINDPQACSPEH